MLTNETFTGETLEEYCCGSEAVLPEGIRISHARFTGNPVAECELCEDFRCSYWECACELVHDCVAD